MIQRSCSTAPFNCLPRRLELNRWDTGFNLKKTDIRYNTGMEKKQVQNEISTLTAVLLMIYVLTLFVNRSVIALPLKIGSFSLNINWKMIDLAAPAAGLLGSLGLYQLIGESTVLTKKEILIQGIIPFATAFSLGVALRNTAVGLSWWIMLFFGGLLLYLVFTAETIVCDPNDSRSVLAEIVLTGLAYATFLMTAIAVRVNLSRLALELPVIALVAFLISMRVFSLRLYRVQPEKSAIAVTLLTVQAVSAFHYWPVNSLSFSILLFLWYYILVNCVILLSQGISFQAALKRQIPPAAILLSLFVIIEFAY